MRFLLLVIVGLLFLQGCHDSKNIQSSGDATYDLKARLEQAMRIKLDALANNPSVHAFDESVLVKNSAGDMVVTDGSAFSGDDWYVGVQGHIVDTQYIEPAIDVWFGEPESAGSTHMAHATFNDYEMFANVRDLHLVGGVGDELLVRRDQSLEDIHGFTWLEKLSLPNPKNTAMVFQWMDIEVLRSQSELKVLESLVIEGRFITSHRKGGVLYVVSHFGAWQYGLNPDASNSQSFEYSELQDYMPAYRIGDSQRRSLSEGCLIFDGGVEEGGESIQLLNITAIDEVSHNVLSSTCVNGDVLAVYMMGDSLLVEDASNTYQFLLDNASVEYLGY